MKLFSRNTIIVTLHLIVIILVVEVKGQQCSRNSDTVRTCGVKPCARQSDCRNENKRCLCDGDCGKICINPRTSEYCQSVERLENGRHWYSENDRLFDTTVTYECNRGYSLSGNASRRCQGDSTWSGTTPQCEPGSTCPRPDMSEGVSLSDNRQEYVEGDLLDIGCPFGYYVRGPGRIMCQADGQWTTSSADITCYPKSCRDPGRLEHGSRSSEVITFGAEMIYTCDEGYTLVGRAWMVCGANTEWSSPTPHCVPVECPLLNVPENGEYSTTRRTFNTRVVITCNSGFEAAGKEGHLRSVTRTCLADKSWSGEDVVCQDVDCGDLAYLPNGQKESLSEDQTTYGSIFHITCDEGTQFDGSDTTACGADGRWTQPLPKCWERCVIPGLTNGGLYAPHARHQIIDHEGSFGFWCYRGYQKSGYGDVSCFNGTLSYEPRCDPKPCSIYITTMPGTRYMHNGTLLHAGRHSIEHNLRVRVECQDGYNLKGNDDHPVCDRGQMRPLISWCVERSCTVPTVTGVLQIHKSSYGAVRDYQPGHQVESNGQITMSCDMSRYRGEDIRSTCHRGNWDPDLITVTVCQPRGCALPQVEYHTVYNTAGTSVDHAGYLRISCIDGYTKDSIPDIVVCHYGSWLNTGTRDSLEKDSLVCQPEPCDIPYIRNGRIVRIDQQDATIPVGNRVPTNDQVKLFCSDGYEITAADLGTKQATLQCQYGRLVGFSECNREASCRNAFNIPGTTYTCDRSLVSQWVGHDTRVTVTCGPHYNISDDNSSVHCYQGRWKTAELRSFVTLPACYRSNCPLPHIQNGFVALSRNSLTELNSGVTIEQRGIVWQKCLPSFRLDNGQSEHRLICQNGFGALPSCIPKTCVIAASNAGTKYYFNGTVELYSNETIADGIIISMKCSETFRHRGKKMTNLTCEGQTWLDFDDKRYSDIPKCLQNANKRKCEKLPAKEYNRTTYIPIGMLWQRRKVNHLTKVTVECFDGMDTSFEEATCRYGIWQPGIPECRFYCTVPASPVVMWRSQRLKPGHRIYNFDVVDSLCDTGYVSADTQVQEITVSCINGTWNNTMICLPSCTTPRVNNARVIGLPQLEPGSTTYNHGDTALVECLPFYSFRDKTVQRLIECNNSSWNPTALQCHLILQPCMTPAAPSSDIKIYNSIGTEIREQEEVPVDDRIEIHCANTAVHVNWECTSEGWSPLSLPDCSPKCPKPILAEHTLLSTNKDIYEEHEILTVSCDPGFVLIGANERIQCESSGNWNIPRSKRHKCELFDISTEELPSLGEKQGVRVTCTISNAFRWSRQLIYKDGRPIPFEYRGRSSTSTVYSSRIWYMQRHVYQCVSYYGTRRIVSTTVTI